jgi:multiple sugar transport system substrate-binding protein
MDIAKFFQGREIDGNTVYGASIFTERASEGITMGATGALYAWGFKYEAEPGTYEMEGVVNSPEAIEALEFYKELYECCTPPGYTDAYMEESLDAFKSGQVAMAMNWFAFFPGLHADPTVGARTSASSSTPGQNVAASTLGGQGISVVSYSDNQEGALDYIKWFAQPEIQQRWWELGGYPVHNAVLNDPASRQRAVRGRLPPRPWAACRTSGRSRPMPTSCSPMQKRLHDYIVGRPGHRPRRR